MNLGAASLPYVVALNCVEKAEAQCPELAGLCVLEHVGLVEGMLDKVSAASIVVLPSLQYLPRAAQKKLTPSQLILCLGATSDMRPVESSLAEELGLRLVHVDVPRADEVADTVMALMLGLVRNTHTLAAQGCTSASWHGGFRDAWAGMRRLKGLTLGLVGVNASGRAVARRAAAFGMKVVYCDLESELLGADVAQAKRKGKIRKALQSLGKGMMTVRETVERSDIVSLHCALKDDTLHLINDKSISFFKKGSMLINASSCHLVNDSAVKRALQAGILSCCGLDGVEGPQWMEAWVREFPKVLILPRSADHSTEVWGELWLRAVGVIRAFLTDHVIPPNTVTVEDMDQEEAAWAQLGFIPALGAPAVSQGKSPSSGSSQAPAGGANGTQESVKRSVTEPRPGVTEPRTSILQPLSASVPVGRSTTAPLATDRESSGTGGGAAAAVAAAAVVAATAGEVGLGLGETVGAVASDPKRKALIRGDKKTGSGSGSGRERVSFGEVEVIKTSEVVRSPGTPEQPNRAVYGKQDSSNSMSGDGPLMDGALVALRLPPSLAKGAPAQYFIAHRASSDPAFSLALSADYQANHPAAQFTLVCEKETLGCRSIAADGRFLQATAEGSLLFEAEEMDGSESWFFQFDTETLHIRLQNVAYDKIVLEAVVEFLS